MKTSTEINSASRIVGEEKAIELIAKAGFDAWDFSMFSMGIYDWGKKTFNFETGHPLSGNDYLAFARKLKKIGEDNGIHCNQSHAPFPSGSDEIFPYLLRAIECTAEAGGEICVIHPESFSTPEQNAEMYAKLLEFSKPMGVKIATENMWGWNSEKNRADFAACATPESFVAHVDALNDDYMVACLDIGHAEMMDDTNAVELIKALSHRLKSLHIHDNDKWHDSHQIPFTMQIDFPPIVKALKEINYDGYFTLECDSYLKAFNAENVEEGVKNLSDSVKKLADMFDEM